MKQIRINESELHRLIAESIANYFMTESDEDIAGFNDEENEEELDEEVSNPQYQQAPTRNASYFSTDNDLEEVAGLAQSKAHRAKKHEKNPDTHEHNKMVKKNNGEQKVGKKSSQKRSIVISWLKDPAVNCAEIMRKLWNPDKDEEDAARSYFYKCRDGKLNDSGIAYRFSDSDINSLYKIKSEK